MVIKILLQVHFGHQSMLVAVLFGALVRTE
jgi:hypothetical protein